MSDSLLNIPCITLHGADTDLAAFAGRAWLVVNTASKCGFTPQYQGLEELWNTYRERGLVVCGFPCNQFGQQEPDDADGIAEFCAVNFGVSFPLFAKTEVNGTNAHPLFQALKKRAPGVLGTQSIKWNFTKFLIGADGQTVQRFAPTTKPKALIDAVEVCLR